MLSLEEWETIYNDLFESFNNQIDASYGKVKDILIDEQEEVEEVEVGLMHMHWLYDAKSKQDLLKHIDKEIRETITKKQE